MQLIIEDLEWQLEGADGNIAYCETQVATRRKWLADMKKELAKEVEALTRATTRKEELKQALEVLRSNVKEELPSEQGSSQRRA